MRRRAARSDLDAAASLYDADRDRIVDIRRAGVLRGLAEGYADARDPKAALALYRRAAGEGMVNPNARPRAEDLAATCCSMAVHAVEPDDALRAYLRQIRSGLGNPW